jgi:tetratricopeptide (TPR) repeat protein
MRGESEYAAAMARTRQLKPAYEAYDEGRKALADKQLDLALAKADEALKLFNGEAHFHALRGDIRLIEHNYDWAETNYTRAIERRADFFYYHLQRGIARKEGGNTDAAVADLERSIELLPTAPAHYALGDIAKARGDTSTAVQHYRVVAQSGGEYGKAAATEVVRLDLPANPSAYIASRCSADSSSRLIVAVRNETPVAVEGIEVAVTYTDAGGRQVQQRFAINERLNSGDVASVNTGMGPYQQQSPCPAEVVAARLSE